MRRQSELDRAIKRYSKRLRRQEDEVRRAEQEEDTQRRQQAREDIARRQAERDANTQRRQRVRQDEEKRQVEQDANTQRRQQVRQNEEKRQIEQQHDTGRRRIVRENASSSYSLALATFHARNKEGPVHVCLSCGGLFFQKSVTTRTHEALIKSGCSADFLQKVIFFKPKEKENIVLCSTCCWNIQKSKVSHIATRHLAR